MKDNDIIKDLECCLSNEKAKNKALEMDNAQLQSDIINANMNCEHLQAEVDRLKSMNQSKLDIIHDIRADLETAKAEKDNLIRTYKECALEVVKEFVERLKEEAFPAEIGKYTYDIVTTKCIDNIVKEMVGDME